MKAATVIGLVIAFVGLAGGATIEGTAVTAIIQPPALLIVLGGTFGATMASCGMEGVKAIVPGYKLAMSPPDLDLPGRVRELVGLAERARKEGLLALEGELETIDDAFMRSGLQLVVDGTEPELVRDVLEAEIDGMETRHKQAYDVFEKAGGFAPTIGIIGTVLSLIHVLGNLADPGSLGPSISGAFIATLLGVGTANIVYLPIGGRLKKLSGQEAAMRTMVLEGILAIQAGDNPRIVTEKLLTYLPPADREAAREPSGPNLRLADPPAAAAQAA
ncbi:MAG: flagellar motor protein [Solirubrobacteraceae bacterium]